MQRSQNNTPFTLTGKRGISYFLSPYFLFFIVTLAALIQYPKAELHLLMNENHTPFGDFFYRMWTEMGGGTVPFIFLGLFLLYRYSYALYLLSAQLAGGIISLIGKRGFNEPRPLLYFQEKFSEITLPAVEGVRMYKMHSFPSGHTVTAFALFFGLALIVKNKWLKSLFFVMAALVGYSRVYLSQHFAIDILVGSAIGIFAAWVCYPLLRKMDKKWGKRSLYDSILHKKNKYLLKST